MRNPDRWRPSKYLQRGRRLVASHDASEVGIGSRLTAGAVAACYADALPRYARGRLGDLGCGKVPLYGAYRGLVSETVCVDWANSPHASLHLDAEVDLGARLPFEDARFDTIILSDVLEHLPEPLLLWREMARLLAPGGHALINVPFLYGLHELPHDYYRYTEFALRRHAQLAGLELSELKTVGGSLHVLADIVAKQLAYLPLLGRPLAIGLQALVSALDRTRPGRVWAARSGERWPLGYFLVVRRP